MKNTNESFKRNSFKQDYFINECLAGEFQFPMIYAEPQNFNHLVSFNVFNSRLNKKVGVHFFIDDYQFERIWTKPTRYVETLKHAEVVLSPDFSMYTDMPKAFQIYNCYRNRALACYLQKKGVNIVPTVSWSDEGSFAWCFDGIIYGSAVAISSNGCIKNKTAKENFLKGFYEMIKVINPSQIIFVGRVPKELQHLEKIKNVEAFGQILSKSKQKEEKWEEEVVV